MRTKVEIGGVWWSFASQQAWDLSIPLDFQGAQPSAFGLPRAEAKAFRAGGFVGDTREGGSVNCFDVTLNPHGNGTHTECIGHILDERVWIGDILEDAFFAACVISVPLVPLRACEERWEAPHEGDDWVVAPDALNRALGAIEQPWREALVLRTLPNESGKREACYSGNNPPYLSASAMESIVAHGVQHLLLDLPSVDRESDGGSLSSHHRFWGVPAGEHAVSGAKSRKTITEMIFVPDEIPDGSYLLNLQVPHFRLDAAPSRPLLFVLMQA